MQVRPHRPRVSKRGLMSTTESERCKYEVSLCCLSVLLMLAGLGSASLLCLCLPICVLWLCLTEVRVKYNFLLCVMKANRCSLTKKPPENCKHALICAFMKWNSGPDNIGEWWYSFSVCTILKQTNNYIGDDQCQFKTRHVWWSLC